MFAEDGPIGKIILSHVAGLNCSSSFLFYVSPCILLISVVSFGFFIQVAENLAQLMYSVMMTGYMFRNAQYRLELQESLEQVALPDVQDKKVTLFLSPLLLGLCGSGYI